MKIVITEDQHKMLMTKFYRRLNSIQEYIDNLDRDSICHFWTLGESNSYVDNTIIDISSDICDQIGSSDMYDEIHEYLVDNGYRSIIEDFFFDTKHNYCSK